MKKILCLLLAMLLMLPVFAGCSQTVDYQEHLADYVKTLPYRDGFTILQLTDIHWGVGTQTGNDTYGSRQYLKKVIDEAVRHAGKIDLIEITGDTFMLSNSANVRDFIDFMTEIGIPYAITWGNHDREGTYNPNWISRQFLNAPNCLYTEVDNDNVHDRSNYVINLTDADGNAVWQIVNLDSGASYRDGAGDLGLTYDYLREDQLEWMSAQHKAVGDHVPALCYFHIAQADIKEAYDAIQANTPGYKSKFFMLEGGFGASKKAGYLHDIFRNNNVKGVFMGHVHAVDWTYTTPDGITYGFGVKSGTELYYGTVEKGNTDGGVPVDETFNLTGASLVTIQNTSGDFALEHLYYNERTDGDFVRWVNYDD